MTKMQQAMKRAIREVGGYRKLARAIGTSGQLVSYMAKNKASATYVLKIEEVTGVSRHDLRPDIYPQPEE